jgi:murein DD-endopeptidase MepM/ murein hydrolase activator NlpD
VKNSIEELNTYTKFKHMKRNSFVKNWWIVILVMTFSLSNVLLVSASSFESQIQKKNEEIKNIENQIRAVNNQQALTEKEKENKEKQVLELKTKVQKLNEEVRTLNNEIGNVRNQIMSTEKNIKDKEENIIEMRKTVELKKKTLADLIVSLYERAMMRNELSAAMSSVSISDVFDEVKYSGELHSQLRGVIADIQKQSGVLEEEKVKLNEEKVSLDGLQNILNEKKEQIESNKNNTQNLATQKAKEAVKLEANIDVLEDQEKALESKKVEVRKELARLEESLSRSYTGGAVCAGSYVWPVKGGSVTQGYGMTAYAKSGAYGGSIHNGIDISAPIGTPIYATESGTVVSVGYNRYSYGKWVVIEHKDGFYSLYGHLSVQSVGNGQAVSAGQQIGEMGSTGFSTGSHLHFTVYAPGTLRLGSSPYGVSVNPMTCKF